VMRMIVGRGLIVTMIGLAVGAAVAAPLSALLRSQVFGISVHDPVTFALVPTVMALVALLACFIPAYRATRVDPLVVLRSE
jgi:putative ABC transport system permease protein